MKESENSELFSVQSIGDSNATVEDGYTQEKEQELNDDDIEDEKDSSDDLHENTEEAEAGGGNGPESTREEEAAARAAIEEDIRKIGGLDPSIRTIEDIVKMPNHDRFYELVKRGNTLYDAYRLVNLDRLIGANAEAEKRRALTLRDSKEHLKARSQRGGGAVSVPSDIMALYRELMPDVTAAEIQRHYNKTLRK